MGAIQPLNLDCIEEPFFRRALRRHIEEYVAHFGECLVALYLSGSVHRNEAVPGVSDLDSHSFIADSLREEDHAWWRRAGAAMDCEFGPLHGICRPRTVADVFLKGLPTSSVPQYEIAADPGDRTLRLRLTEEQRVAILARSYGILLRYDATLLWGRDVTDELVIPPPARAWAQISFLSPWEIVRYAAGVTRENRTDFDLPEEPSLRLRYLAKLAVYGGASLLMSRGQFRAYRGPDVLDPLARAEPGRALFLAETRGLYVRPVPDAAARLPAYLERVSAWMEWIGRELEYELTVS